MLDNTLANDPIAGVVIRGTGAVSKLRVALDGGGKSGGARVIYSHLSRTQRIFLLAVYAKSEKDNLSAEERNPMRRLVVVLEGEK